MPNKLSRENHGTISSTYYPKLLPQPPSRLTRVWSEELLSFAKSLLEKFLNQEKSREETITTLLKNTETLDPTYKKRSPP